MALSAERLAAVKKALLAEVKDDPEAAEEVNKSFAGLEAALTSGEAVTADELADIIGDVVVTKQNTQPAVEPQDPLAPLFVGLHKALVGDDGQIKKSLDRAAIETAIQATYEKALGTLDEAIEGAVSATVSQFGGGASGGATPVAKSGKGKDKEDEAGNGGDDDDEDCDDMDKMLKALVKVGAPAALIKKMSDQQERIEALEAERDLVKFTKMAEDIGEGAAFATTLMNLHQEAPEAAAEIVKRLKTKNEALRKSDLWGRELGGDGGEVTGTALNQLEGHAREMVQKGEKDSKGKVLTFAKAFTEACTRFPDLYAEYRRAQR